MSSNTTVLPQGLSAHAYCLDTSVLPLDQCPGICINQDLSAYPAVISFVLASIVTGLAMIWLPEVHDRRHQYYLHYMQSVSRIVSGFLFFLNRKINTFDVYLILLLVMGSETIAIIGAASRLHIVEYPYHLGVVKPLLSMIAIITLGVLAGPHHGWITDLDAVKTLGTAFLKDGAIPRGSQPACNFTFRLASFVPLAIFTGVALISVFCSGTQWFARFIRRCFSDSDIKSLTQVRVMWTIFIIIVNVTWIACTFFFMKSYLDLPTIINKDIVRKVSSSQLFSIFLSATSTLPSIKHLFSQIKKYTGWNGEKWRKRNEKNWMDGDNDSASDNNQEV